MKNTQLQLSLLFAILLNGGNIQAQKYWDCSKGSISFFSKTPVEDIDAESNAAGAIINTENGVIAFKVPLKTFKFKNALMEEHFHENYMETDKEVKNGDKVEYPNKDGLFQGKLEPKIDFSKPGMHQVKAKGKLKIHGVEVEREFSGTIEVKADKTAQLKSTMDVPLADHNIERPQMVLMKIADKIKVDVDFTLRPKI
jgi:hypothetical protein